MSLHLKFILFFGLLSFEFASAASRADEEKANSKSAVEIIRPENYSIRRFQEVIQNSRPNEETSPQEDLIAMRAKLIIAQQRLQDLKAKHTSQQLAPPANEAQLIRDVQLRSAQAQVDHFSRMVSRNEEKILKEKRNERNSTLKKNRKTK